MVVILIVYISLLIMALTSGFNSGVAGWSLRLEVNSFKTAYFNFGLSHEPLYTETSKVQVVTLGFVAFSLIMEFYDSFSMMQEDRERMKVVVKKLEQDGEIVSE